MNKKNVIILGCTGSIGKSAIDIIRSHRDKFAITGLSCHKNEEALLKYSEEFNVKNICLSGGDSKSEKITYSNSEGLEKLIAETDADIVLNGISGSSGLRPSISALKAGKDLALANKETIVMAGPLIKDLALKNNRKIIPIDSEHSAIFNLVSAFGIQKISEIILTASGGAFRNLSIDDLENVDYEKALNHPTWNMGIKITIDSATLANKGLEVIEACRLFDLSIDKIKVLIHPQSCVHSLIRTTEGSMYAQISKPDMRIPIQNALTYPEVMNCGFGYLDLADNTLSFAKPDFNKYPMLKLGYSAAEQDGAYPIVYNASNETAVQAFIEKRIGYFPLCRIVEKTLEKEWPKSLTSFQEVFEIDKKARLLANNFLKEVE